MIGQLRVVSALPIEITTPYLLRGSLGVLLGMSEEVPGTEMSLPLPGKKRRFPRHSPLIARTTTAWHKCRFGRKFSVFVYTLTLLIKISVCQIQHFLLVFDIDYLTQLHVSGFNQTIIKLCKSF